MTHADQTHDVMSRLQTIRMLIADQTRDFLAGTGDAKDLRLLLEAEAALKRQFTDLYTAPAP